MPNTNKRINRLREEIAEHDRLYYKDAMPRIDDQAYDRLKGEDGFTGSLSAVKRLCARLTKVKGVRAEEVASILPRAVHAGRS